MSEVFLVGLFCFFPPVVVLFAITVYLWRMNRRLGSLHAEVAEQRAVIHSLVRRVYEIEQRGLGQPDPGAAPDAAAVSPVGQPSDLPVTAAPVEAAAVEAPPLFMPAAPVSTPSSAAPLPSPVFPSAPAQTPEERTEEESRPTIFQPFLDWFLGMAVVVRVGIVLLFIGVAFLFRYAVDQGWLSVEVRLVGAALLGGLLIAIGWRLRDRQPAYALTLQGGGFGIAYMTVFAAFRLYGLLPGLFALLLLIILMALCMALAVFNNSRALAVLSIGGGFLAPLLVSTGEGSHVALFGYYLVLNVGILGVAWFKAWRELNLLGFVFTFVLGSLWGAGYYQPSFFSTVEPFLLVFFLFYVTIAILFARLQPPRLLGFVDGPLVFGTPIVALALQQPLVADFPNGMAWSAAGAGLFYLILAAVLGRSGQTNFAPLSRVFVPLGTLLLSLAVPLAFSADITTYLWAVEGAALVWLGLRQGRRFYPYFGSLLQVAAGGALFSHLAEMIFTWDELPLLNAGYLGAVIVALSALCSAYFFFSHQREQGEESSAGSLWLHGLLTIYGFFWWYLGGLLQVLVIGQHYNNDYFLTGLLSYVALSAFVGEAVGGRLRWTLLRLPWLGVLPLAGIFYLIQMGSGATPFRYGGWYALSGALLVSYWSLYRWDGSGWQRFYHAASLWLIGLIGSAEIAGLAMNLLAGDTGAAVASTYLAALWPFWFVLLISAVIWFGPRLAWPTARHYRLYVGPILVFPAALLVGWSVWANLLLSGASGGLPYLPILNPLGVANLAALGLLLGWLQYLKRLDFPLPLVKAGRLGVIFVIFFWVNMEMARTAHHWQSLPYQFDALFASPLLQAAYSIVWGILALLLMFGATRRGVRWVWMLGGALLALTVLKLFLVDLAGTGTVARIVSFLGVGILMTVIGYFAPVPPAAEDRETA